MTIKKGIVFYLVLGCFCYASDFISENKNMTSDLKSNVLPSELENRQGDYAVWKDNQQGRNVKKNSVRQRTISPYRGFCLVNLTMTTSFSDSTSLESQQDSDNAYENEHDEGFIEVAYAKELFNYSADLRGPTRIDHERW